MNPPGSPSEPHLKFAVLAADTALFTMHDNNLFVRLIRVHRPPHFSNKMGLPGGLLNPKETAEDAAMRHLTDKSGVDAKNIYREQLYTFSRVNRDPRGRVVAVAYIALVPWESLSHEEQNDSEFGHWVSVSAADKLAYDHDEILAVAIQRLRSRLTYTTVMSKLMPKEFTLSELERGYETVLGRDLDKRNFRKKILKTGTLKEVPGKRTSGKYRPAQLYRFVSEKVAEIQVI